MWKTLSHLLTGFGNLGVGQYVKEILYLFIEVTLISLMAFGGGGRHKRNDFIHKLIARKAK